MAETTLAGGASVKQLTPAERHAAINALSKLTGATASKGVASVMGGSLKSATLKGGMTLVSGHGADTYAGGVKSTVKPAIHAIGNDTVVAGSAFAKSELAHGGSRALSSDTIKIAGTTAAGVKSALDTKPTGHTITMADKTSITLNGVTPHNIVKPH